MAEVKNKADGAKKSPAAKERIDKLLVDRGLVETRTRAQALILAGEVLVDDQPVDKAGSLVPVEAEIRLRTEALPFVSRGGLKLQKALDHFAIDVSGQRALDVGASTGGFTDCLLQRGATAVCAVDVGYGQLAWKLRQDPRVSLLERVNARNLRLSDLPWQPELAVCDVSFISLTLILPPLVEILGAGEKTLITLIKPQFEVGKGELGKNGVVRDSSARTGAVEKCCAAAAALGCTIVGVVESPLLGPAGNVEYLLYATTHS